MISYAHLYTGMNRTLLAVPLLASYAPLAAALASISYRYLNTACLSEITLPYTHE